MGAGCPGRRWSGATWQGALRPPCALRGAPAPPRTNNNNYVIPYNDSAKAFVAERRTEQRKIYAIETVYQFMFPELPELPEPAVSPFQRLKTRMQRLAKTENLGSVAVAPDTLVIRLSSPNSENIYFALFLTKSSSGKFDFTILCQSKNHTTPSPPRVTRSSQNSPTQPSTMEYSPEPNRPYQACSCACSGPPVTVTHTRRGVWAPAANGDGRRQM